MRPATDQDKSIEQLELPQAMLEIHVPTCVIWAMADIALPAGLIEGLDAYIDHLTLHKIEDGTHWVIHEQPQRVQAYLRDFFA
jgi:pimeloyl-ACP methyl ester carboxylesterase